MTTERIHHPFSPSRLPRLYHCPGSFKLAPPHGTGPRVSSPEADEGTMLHERVASGDLAGLTEEQSTAVQTCLDFLETNPRKWKHEMTLSVTDESTFSEITYGYVDAVGLRETRDPPDRPAIVADWKFGRTEVPEPADNLQLAAYALAVHQEYGCPEVRAVILQPRTGFMAEHVYRDFAGILATIKTVIRECQGPDMRLCPGEWCRYCPAASACPALNRQAVAMIDKHSSEVTDPETMAAYLTTAAQAKLAARTMVEWADSVLYHALAMARQQPIPGWEIKPGRKVRELTDLNEAFARLKSRGFTEQEFVTACKASVPTLEATYCAKLATTAKDAKASFAAALGDLIDVKTGNPTMVRQTAKES